MPSTLPSISAPRHWNSASPTARDAPVRPSSFVNGQYTSDGGTHLSAFREGLLKAVNEYAKGKHDGDDVRECMVGAVAIRLQEPMFESQTKNKLGNTEIRSELVTKVREEVLHLLHQDKKVADTLLAKVEDTRKLRKELMAVKKLATRTFQGCQLADPSTQGLQEAFQQGKRQGTRHHGFHYRGSLRRRLHRELS